MLPVVFSACFVVAIALVFSVQESSYNPFYSDVAVKLCNFNGRFKFTFQLVLWDEFKGMAEHSVRAQQAVMCPVFNDEYCVCLYVNCLAWSVPFLSRE